MFLGSQYTDRPSSPLISRRDVLQCLIMFIMFPGSQYTERPSSLLISRRDVLQCLLMFIMFLGSQSTERTSLLSTFFHQFFCLKCKLSIIAHNCSICPQTFVRVLYNQLILTICVNRQPVLSSININYRRINWMPVFNFVHSRFSNCKMKNSWRVLLLALPFQCRKPFSSVGAIPQPVGG